MVYKKYIKKDGKRYGPYYYESERIGDKVMTKYLSKPPSLFLVNTPWSCHGDKASSKNINA